MAINLSALSKTTTSITALSNLILVTPQSQGYQPQNPYDSTGNPSTDPAPKPLLFHYEGEQTLTIESDITDHFVEDNTAIQDQIALRPEIITTHGFIGELNDIPPNVVLAALKTAADKLTVVSAYTPTLSATALLAYNTAFQLYQTGKNALNAGVSAASSIGIGSGSQTEQQLYFQQFYGYWKSRTLFTVQTPWAVFKDMAIKTLRAIQDDTTNVITDFEVTFKQIRFSQALTSGTRVTLHYGNNRGPADAASAVNLGDTSPPAAPYTLGSKLQ